MGSGSIRAPRRRPRVRSVCFKSFGWVLRREAALRILYLDVMDTALEYEGRAQVNGARTDRLSMACRMLLAQHPERHWFPASYGVDAALSTVVHHDTAEPEPAPPEEPLPF